MLAGGMAPAEYTKRSKSAEFNLAFPDNIGEARNAIRILMRENGALREKLFKAEEELKELKTAYAELDRDYMRAKMVALRMRDNIKRGGIANV